MKNYQSIDKMSVEELAKEFVIPIAYTCGGYRWQTTFFGKHVGEFDTKEEAEEAELNWLVSEVEKE